MSRSPFCFHAAASIPRVAAYVSRVVFSGPTDPAGPEPVHPKPHLNGPNGREHRVSWHLRRNLSSDRPDSA